MSYGNLVQADTSNISTYADVRYLLSFDTLWIIKGLNFIGALIIKEVLILLDGNYSKNDEKNFRKIKYKINTIIVCVCQKKLLK